ncbi:hypothetical protein RND71_013589 [Anisodus tanguticus]|uniref:Uncharacterized protein n=1 Tax=Anisodus tanguticus TaxID=243964 RepID=A0AAE1VLV8_9SOLA|nr:hypothetical protein RND71_013589 [Anisodus tanguticus]
MEVAEEKGKGSPVVVYLHGMTYRYDLWFRIQVTKDDDKLTRKKIPPIAKLRRSIYGMGGRWTVIGSNIYYAGGYLTDRSKIIPRKELIKHNTMMTQDAVDSWETESSLNLSRRSPVVAAVGKTKICVLGGENRSPDSYKKRLRVEDEEQSDGYLLRNKGGEIYDIDGKCWNYVDTDLKYFTPYNTLRNVAVVVEKEQEQTSQIVFYSLIKGSIMLFDATTGKISMNETFKEFVLWNRRLDTSPPLGLGSDTEYHFLHRATMNVPAVFTNDTFYWFTLDMYLYAYDVKASRWFKSQCLLNQLLDLYPKLVHNDELPFVPILVGLPQDGKFVVFIPRENNNRTELIMACLKVEMKPPCLNVLMEFVQHLYFAEEIRLLESLIFYDGKAIVEG